MLNIIIAVNFEWDNIEKFIFAENLILFAMEKTTKTNGTKNRINIQPKPKRKSKYALWLEKHPNGIGKILDMEAVLQ